MRVDSQPDPGPQAADPFGRISRRSYGTAVAISAVFGFLGIQHFYLGRIGEGLLDLGLSIAWLVCFATGETALGVVFLVADFGHSILVTILLLTGNYRDGEGRLVCYPGQKLGSPIPNPRSRRGT